MTSQKQMAGVAIVMFLRDKMGDFDPDEKKNTIFRVKWKDFPRLLVKATTANTHFFTRLIEMSQLKQVQDKSRYLQLLLYFIF